MNLRFTRIIFLGIIISNAACSLGMFPTNLFRAFDINLRPPIWHNTRYQFTGWFEQALHVQAFNGRGEKVDQLQFLTTTQDALAMLRGYPSSSPMSIFLDDVLDNPTDDGVRGNFIPDGRFIMQAGGLSFRFHTNHNFSLIALLPFYRMAIENVRYTDLTPNASMTDIIIKQELTSVLQQRIAEFDPSLNIFGWDKLGFGDLILGVDWFRTFVQAKPVLKNVDLNARLNLSLPTGIKKDEDNILSLPFGFDGSVGLIFGGGIDLTWFDYIKGGIDVEFIYLFGNTRTRRIKVDPAQTDFFLLTKVRAHKEFGFTQRFNLYGQAYKIWRGLSATITYQYWQHGDDHLSLFTNEFSNDVANSAEYLQEWILHNMIFSLSYDCQDDIDDCSFFKPQFSAFYKLGFNGTRALMVNSIGGTFSLSF